MVIDTMDNVNRAAFLAEGLTWVDDVFGKRGGAAQHHHRDGYNVLYGDSHAAWYGDAGQSFAFAFGGGHNGNTTWATGSYSFSAGIAEQFNLTSSGLIGLALPFPFGTPGADDTDSQGFSGGQDVWNWFDQATGIDIR